MLSKYQIKTIQDFMPSACAYLMKKNNLQCSVTATRVIYDVLTKLHFKVKPLAVEARAYNPLYTQKLRPPDSDEEANKWLEEGCWSVVLGTENVPKAVNKWSGHLVAIINDICIMDLAIIQAYRPDKNLIVDPVFAEINGAFLNGYIQRGVENKGCLVVYKATDNQDFLKSKEWIDKKSLEVLEKDVVQGMRVKPKPIIAKRSSPILKEAKHLALMESSYDEIAVSMPTV